MMKDMQKLKQILELFFAGASAALVQVSLALADSNCTGNSLCNPLNPQFNSIPGFISGVLKVMVEVALPIITIFIVYAGFKFVAARGNPGKLDEAKQNFVWVIFGALLILGAWVIATLIGGTVTQLVGTQTSL